jgi:ATP-dependent DNA helicase RecG
MNETAVRVPEKKQQSDSVVTPQMKTVLEYLSEYGEISDEDFQELLGIKRTRAYVLAKQMYEAGLIDKTGRGKTKRYRLK